MLHQRMRCLLIVSFAVLYVVPDVISASAHKHVHGKERTEDGAFSPRDHNHLDQGEHHNEFDHEAIIGSVREAEEFDNLSPEESKKRLSLLVQKMDLNSDLFVDRHELKAWIIRSFKSLSEEEAEDRFEDLDEDNNDLISWAEYMKETYGLEEHEYKPTFGENKDEDKIIRDDKETFTAADSNKDGLLDHEEFGKFHSPEEHPEMFPIILSQTLRDKDSNKDGKIDFQEFVGETAKDQDKEWLLVEKEKFDESFDRDGDGILNNNEILGWIVPSNDDVATEEVDHLFAASDDDHDDRLSYLEIIEKYDIFVGSEATDYGDHLQNIHHFDDEL